MTLTVHIQGPAFWAPGLPDWFALCAAREAGELPPLTGPRAPRPELLAAGDRRRAPETVGLALEAGRMAVASSGLRAQDLLSVFTSAHGDLAIIDSMCRTLAEAPTLVSPTRFLHSIHNAPAGLWSMAAPSTRANTSITAGAASFSAGLLEAIMQCIAERSGVLFVAYEPATTGPLAATIRSDVPMAFALVVTPAPTPGTVVSVDATTRAAGPSAGPATGLAAWFAAWFADSAMANGMALIDQLAIGGPVDCCLDLGGGQALVLTGEQAIAHED